MAKPCRGARERESSGPLPSTWARFPLREAFEMVEAIDLMAEGMIARHLLDEGKALATVAGAALDRLAVVRRLWGKMT